MANFSSVDRAFVISQFYLGGRSTIRALRAFRLKHKIKQIDKGPSSQMVARWIKNYEETGSTEKQPRKKKAENTARSPQAIEAVRKLLKKDPGLSQRRLAETVGISKSTVQRIINSDLKLKPPQNSRPRTKRSN